MKRNAWKKIASCMLSALLLFGTACGGGQTSVEEVPTQRVLTQEEIVALGDKVPDYSAYTNQFNFFAYSSMSDGTWTENGQTFFSGEDFRNYERVKEYKEAGMTIIMPQSTVCIDETTGLNFNFEKSAVKEMMDWAEQAGLKVIVTDYRLYKLLRADSESLIGEGDGKYATEEDLDAVVRAYMEPYASHPAFYGVQLPDERPHYVFKSFGEIYKSIKRCYPTSYPYINLIPPMAGVKRGEEGHLPQPTDEQIQEFKDLGFDAERAEQCAAFYLYLTKFLDESGADYFSYDQYPLMSYNRVDVTYICGLQVAAMVAKERNVEFHLVTQTFAWNSSGKILLEADLRYLNDMALGFGVKQLSYFTYYTRKDSAVESWADGSSFITRMGEKTDIYYNMQKIMAEDQQFAPVIKNFDYQTSAWYGAPMSNYNSSHVTVCANGTFAKIASFTNDKESTLISELYDDDNDRYMYMIQNAINPEYKPASSNYQTTTVTFNCDYNYAVVWKNGAQSIVKLVDNKYSVTQFPGEAVFVIPFNA